jgi:hypothetical protein
MGACHILAAFYRRFLLLVQGGRDESGRERGHIGVASQVSEWSFRNSEPVHLLSVLKKVVH